MAIELNSGGISVNRIGPPLPRPVDINGLARVLRRYFGTAAEVVAGIRYGFPAATALEVGTILIEPDMFPSIGRNGFEQVMRSGSYLEQDIQNAANILFPQPPSITFTVQGNQSWQDTGLILGPNQTAQITYQGGYWWVSPGIGYTDGNGSWSYIAKPGYALAGYAEGGMVGNVGGNAFWVGNQGESPLGWTGNLYLVMNDDINYWYGSGLSDNFGSITVQITIINH